MNEKFTFQEMEYVRPDFEALKEFYKEINARVKNAKSYEEVRACIFEEEKYSSHVNTMATLMTIRHTIDTSDEFYEKEDEYYTHAFPEAMPYMQGFNEALLASPFKEDIDKEFGAQFLKAVKLGADTFSEKNISLMLLGILLTATKRKVVL